MPLSRGTKIASQNRSDHGGRKWARNHSAAEIAGFFASAAAKKSLAASDFWGYPQNRRKLAATTAASRRSRAISRPQRPRDTKIPTQISTTVCANSFCMLNSMILKEKRGTFVQPLPNLFVCGNCAFFWLGVFWGGLPPPHDLDPPTLHLSCEATNLLQPQNPPKLKYGKRSKVGFWKFGKCVKSR